MSTGNILRYKMPHILMISTGLL